MNRLTFTYCLLIILSISKSIFSQDELIIERTGKTEIISPANITSIRAVDGYIFNTTNSKIINDSIVFNSNIYVDSLSKSELNFVRVIKENDHYIFAICLDEIQKISYHKLESKKFHKKLDKHIVKAKRNFRNSIILVGAGIILLIPGYTVAGIIVISVGILNNLKYVYDRKIRFKTKEYDLKNDWLIKR